MDDENKEVTELRALLRAEAATTRATAVLALARQGEGAVPYVREVRTAQPISDRVWGSTHRLTTDLSRNQVWKHATQARKDSRVSKHV